MRKILYFFFLFLILTQNAKGQLSIGITIGGIGFHPIPDSNSDFYKWKVDKKGRFVAFSSVTFNVSYRLNNYLGVKAVQAFIFHDCAGKFAGVSHVGLDFHDDILNIGNEENQLSLSFGPFWYYRKNWSQIPEYNNDPEFITLSKNKIWEHKFVWHGGQIQYEKYLSNSNWASINILPGYPYLYTFSLGINHHE